MCTRQMTTVTFKFKFNQLETVTALSPVEASVRKNQDLGNPAIVLHF